MYTKNISSSKKKNSLMKQDATQRNSAQMIVIMGIVLAISVFMLASIAAEIANLDVIVSTSEAVTLPNEFSNLKEAFGKVLNYNLAEVTIITDPGDLPGFMQGANQDDYLNEGFLTGDITGLTRAFNQTRDEFHQIELEYGRIFDAHLNRYWYAYTGDGIYSVDVTVMLDNGDVKVTEDVVYSIVCLPFIS